MVEDTNGERQYHVKLSAAFAPTLATPVHAAIAEDLGYNRVWVFDSPALYADVWMTLTAIAMRTSRIGIGPGAVIPSLRHVLVTAAAAATLEGQAPGRVAIAVGSGFTGAMALGRKPVLWAEVELYVKQLRSLLRGDQVEVEGRLVQMRHGPDVVPARPLVIPVIVAAGGPRGARVARRAADGIFTSTDPEPGFAWSALLAQGTVLAADEDHSSERILETAGPAAAVNYHAMYERDEAELDSLPNARRWIAAAEEIPSPQRHLHVHDGHLTVLNALDRQALTPEFAAAETLTGHAPEIAGRLAKLREAGVSEIAYQPAGPDIAGELERFAGAAAMANLEFV